jgi:hypothetical protein
MKVIWRPYKKSKKGFWSRKHTKHCDCIRCFKRNEGRYGNGSGIIKKGKSFKLNVKQDYFKYLKSPLWAKRKEIFYKIHPRKCEACGTNINIHLHHMVYGQFGNEPDKHLVSLCEKCHSDFHQIYLVHRDMLAETKQFIETRQNTIRNILKIIKD